MTDNRHWEGQNKTSDELRQDVDRTREELSRDIDDIQARVKTDRLKKEAEEKFEEVKHQAQQKIEEVGGELSKKASETIHSVGSEVTTALADKMRDIPWPVTLGAAALIWLAVDVKDKYQLPRYEVSGSQFNTLSKTGKGLLIAGAAATAAGIMIPLIISRSESDEIFTDPSTHNRPDASRTVYGADGEEFNRVATEDPEEGPGVIRPR